MISWTMPDTPPDEHALGARWLLPVVAETWDGYLNDMPRPKWLPGLQDPHQAAQQFVSPAAQPMPPRHRSPGFPVERRTELLAG